MHTTLFQELQNAQARYEESITGLVRLERANPEYAATFATLQLAGQHLRNVALLLEKGYPLTAKVEPLVEHFGDASLVQDYVPTPTGATQDKPQTIQPIYLGDGVYCDTNPMYVVLHANTYPNPVVYLEPDMVTRLLAYTQRAFPYGAQDGYPVSNCCGAHIIQPDANGHGKCAKCYENCVPQD